MIIAGLGIAVGATIMSYSAVQILTIVSTIVK